MHLLFYYNKFPIPFDHERFILKWKKNFSSVIDFSTVCKEIVLSLKRKTKARILCQTTVSIYFSLKMINDCLAL